MSPERWRQVEEVFQSALDLPPDERRGFVARACAGDAALAEQVGALLSQYESAGDFIEQPALASASVIHAAFDPLDTTPDDGHDPMTGRRVGAYKLVREIGRGGMGAVYLAERADSEFQQRVAIKVVKRGMDTDFILRRFRHERQILASFDHPNIARLLDGGVTSDGLPYFVMEYVEGVPVDAYCDERRLSITERLKLFREVCAAVSYAHRNLVVHRDLKPSNILVTRDGTPKLLDFGIATLLKPEPSARTIEPTTPAVRLLTPEYASPEQVRGETITTAADVYSLGVVLYELLTGCKPHCLSDSSPGEFERIVCEQEPERRSH